MYGMQYDYCKAVHSTGKRAVHLFSKQLIYTELECCCLLLKKSVPVITSYRCCKQSCLQHSIFFSSQLVMIPRNWQVLCPKGSPVASRDCAHKCKLNFYFQKALSYPHSIPFLLVQDSYNLIMSP